MSSDTTERCDCGYRLDRIERDLDLAMRYIRSIARALIAHNELLHLENEYDNRNISERDTISPPADTETNPGATPER